MTQSLFEKYGGFSVVSKVVMSFYDELMESETVGDYFEDVDMGPLIDHQTKFMAYLLGGPVEYSEDKLIVSHRGLGIRDSDFDELKTILEKVLSQHGFSNEDRGTALEAIEARRAIIVTS